MGTTDDLATGVAIVRAVATPTPSAAGMLAIDLANRIGKRQHEKAQKAYDALVDVMCGALDSSDRAQADLAIKTAIAEATPEVEDMLYEWFRDRLDELDPGVLPYAARIAADYIRRKQGRDTFFRRFGGALKEMEAADVGSLQVLVDATRAALAKIHNRAGIQPILWVQFEHGVANDENLTAVSIRAHRKSDRTDLDEGVNCKGSSVGSLLGILSAHRLTTTLKYEGRDDYQAVFKGAEVRNIERILLYSPG